MSQIMKNFRKVSTTKGNNLGLFFQLAFFALFGIMSLFSGQTLAGVQTCTPTTTVTEGDLFPGGIPSFGVSSGPGSVTIDHVNAGTGTQSITVVGVPTNAEVNIPAFAPGTFNPVNVTFTTPNPGLAVDFTLRAASTFHAVFIRVRCAATTCTPTTTVTEGDLFPGGIPSFGVSSGIGSVTIDHVNAGTGTQSITVVGVPTNAEVNILPFAPGTFNPVVVTFTTPNPALPTDFTLRAASTFHAVFIRVRCGTVTPTPTPTPGGTPMPTPTPGGPNTFSGQATSVNATINGTNAILNDTGALPATGGFITRFLASGNLFGGALTTGELEVTTQGAGDQSRSQAIVENLYLNVGGNTFTSGILSESSLCTCTANGPVCEGGLFGNLLINDVAVTITGQPNQTVNLAGGGTVIINEHISGSFADYMRMTANGVRVNIPGTANVILASAHSDLNCAPAQLQGCTRTQGFWKNKPEEWPVNNLTLGTVNYTKAQLLSILQQQVEGNGLISLSHQLIATKLNDAAGTTVPASVAIAVVDADEMIGGRVVPPVGSGSLSTNATSSLTSILDTYNNGDTPGAPRHCD